MTKKRIVIAICVPVVILIIFLVFPKKESMGVIPKPDTMKRDGKEVFLISDSTKILFNGNSSELQWLGNYLKEIFYSSSGFNLTTKIRDHDKESENSIILKLETKPEKFKNEGYTINISQKKILISAKKGAGLFYGIQTLRQLLYAKLNDSKNKSYKNIALSSLDIKDLPVFGWRGMMLDTCRHYMPVPFIKKFIDHLAMYKLNRFHWHLTEDQGWRIEIKRYPKLSKISAWREETVIGHRRDTPNQYDGKKHGGIYTQDQIKEIIKYAKDRYITIIPEIEMPGHSVAALAAYPEISCTGGPFEVKTIWGVHKDVYCAGKEETFEFIENVLSEVMELFPSKYIHIGGDECPKERWKNCPDCQRRIKDEGLKDENELQSYFVKRIEKFLNSKGKKLIGWDEILEGGLAPDATVMSWRGMEGGVKAAKEGHNVIMSPTSYCYFDYYQGNPKTEPLAIGGMLELKKVYSFEPIPSELSEEEKTHILGGQANLWTEYISTPDHAEYMMFPRIAALAEVLWTRKVLRRWNDFHKRVKTHYKIYRRMGINFRE